MKPNARIFICYSDQDEKWKDELLAQLNVLEYENFFDVWVDNRIEAGKDWLPEIQAAIESATIALLLISQHFLNSRFIRREEVPKLLSRRLNDGLRIVPLLIRDCPWKSVHWLRGIELRPKSGRPISSRGRADRERAFADITREIAGLIGYPPGAVQLQSLPSDADSVQKAIENVCEGYWLKIGGHGFSFLVKFRPDGTLTERNLFNHERSWPGEWRLLGQVVEITVITDTKYVLRFPWTREYGGSAGSLWPVVGGLETCYPKGQETTTQFRLVHLRELTSVP